MNPRSMNEVRDARKESDQDTSNYVTGFPSVVGSHPRILILGSMPGRASLQQQEYYALPRNAFWPIMGDLFGAGFDLPYAERLDTLTDNGIALWDVLESCHRPGSLDSAIADTSAEPNDFADLFRAAPSITHVFFNGRKAADVYRRRVLPTLENVAALRICQTLPSTSPAHATRSYAQKLAEWSVVREVLEQSVREE